LRYVKKGRAVVRFLGIAHVEDTSAMTLKAIVEHILSCMTAFSPLDLFAGFHK
jgi:hypothetical protein